MNFRFQFNQGWKFIPSYIPEAVSPDYPLTALAAWEDAALPHTPRIEPYRNGSIPTWQGLGMYRKHFPVGTEYQGKKLFLEFEAVMGVTDVWLNGIRLHTAFGDLAPDRDGAVHTNCGGYLPFVVELTPHLHFDQENVLVVLTDNRDNGQVPPGKPQALLDFTYFGGIYRNVWLNVCEAVYITDPLFENLCRGGGVVFETRTLSPDRADVVVRIHVRNTTKTAQTLTLRVSLEDAAEASLEFTLSGGTAQTLSIPLTVRQPKLWSLDEPNRYTLTCALSQGGETLHLHREKVGLRLLTVNRETGLLLNGKPLPLLSGINRHQDFPLLGNAAPSSLQRQDALLYKNAGFTVVRAAHYPMSVDFLDACDALGIFLIEATPGWQWYPVGEDQPFTARVHQNIRQMVRRDRNHPCILAYETVLNETYHVPKGYTKRMEEIALEESADARVAAESYGYDVSVNGVDKLADFIYGFQDPLKKTEKALMFLREYGDSWQEAYGNRMSRRVTRGECGSEYPGGPAENLRKANNLLFDHQDDFYTLADCYKAHRESPSFAGCAIWTGIDSRGMWSKISPCGIWDSFRLPKTSYYAFASQRPAERRSNLEALGVETGPLVHIAPYSSDVYVYANGDTVELEVLRNDTAFYCRRQTPMMDGLCAELPHPPFLFQDVPHTENCRLVARSFDRNGQLLAVSDIRPAGKPCRIVLEAPNRSFTADGSDILPVYAKIVDKNGSLCTEGVHSIKMNLKGDGQLIGAGSSMAAANPAITEAGIAAFYVRAGAADGSLTLRAECAGLERADLVLTLSAPTVPSFPFISLPHGPLHPLCSNNLADMLVSGGQVRDCRRSGVFYPNSIVLEEKAVFRLLKPYTKLYGRLSLKKGSAARLYADGVLLHTISRSGPLRLILPEAEILTLEVPAGSRLLSPYLSEEPVSIQETRTNLAVRKRCTASSNPEMASNVMGKGHLWETMWVGDAIVDHPEYFELDLGNAYDVEDAMVYIGGQMGSDCTNYSYEIWTSRDRRQWETQVQTRRTSWSNGILDKFRAQSVRYLRVVFTNVDGGLLPALSKIQIYQQSLEV